MKTPLILSGVVDTGFHLKLADFAVSLWSGLSSNPVGASVGAIKKKERRKLKNGIKIKSLS